MAIARIANVDGQLCYSCLECNEPLTQFATNSELWICPHCNLWWVTEQGEAELTSVAEKAGMSFENFTAGLIKLARKRIPW